MIMVCFKEEFYIILSINIFENQNYTFFKKLIKLKKYLLVFFI